MSDEDRATIHAMIRFGGGFVNALGKAALLADERNLERIAVAFPDLWDRYAALAKENAR